MGKAFLAAAGAVWHKISSDGGDFSCILVHLSRVATVLNPE